MNLLIRLFAIAPTALLLACARGETPSSPVNRPRPSDAAILPLVRVRLYSSGVGYFERHGDVSAGQHMLPVPLGHLDDALKSLVLLSAGSEPVSLSFPSRVSPAVARARAGLPAAENAALSYDRLLAALRGEAVRVTLADTKRFGTAELEGRVVEVVSVEPSHPSYDHGPPANKVEPSRKTEGCEDEDEEAEDEANDAVERVKRGNEVTRLQLILLSEPLGMIRFDVSELLSVRPIDPEIAERFQAAMAARIATRANPTEWLELAKGKSQIRDLSLGYLAETPLWRTSYRLRVEPTGRAELQAWALLHNDTDEVWRGVKVELVDGAPSSWLYPLAAPRYERRELVTPADELSSVPQLSTTTPDAMWGDFSDYQGELIENLAVRDAFGVGGLGLSGTGEGGGGRGEGIGFGSIGTLGHGGSSAEASDLLIVGDLARYAARAPAPQQTSSLFAVKGPLHLLPQHSALLPFLQQGISAKTMVWFSGLRSEAARGLGLVNDTAYTLPEGPMSVFGSGGFLGEATLSRLQPGARQFARIGAESEVQLSNPVRDRESHRRHVDVATNRLRVHSLVTTKNRVVFENRSGAPQQAYVEMELVDNATLQGADRLDFEVATGTPLAVFDVPEGSGKERLLVSQEGIAEGTPIEGLTFDDLDALIRDTELPADERAILQKARVVLERSVAVTKATEELSTELRSVAEELERLKQTSRDMFGEQVKDKSTVMTSRMLAGLDKQRILTAKERSLKKELAAHLAQLTAVLSELNAVRPRILKEQERKEPSRP